MATQDERRSELYGMFTGIISEIGTVHAVVQGRGRVSLKVSTSEAFSASGEQGQSVAVDGVCLSITEVGRDHLCFDVIDESLRRSTLGRLQAGHQVHLEHSMKFGAPVGGHLVSGHVHGTFEVVRIEDWAEFSVLWGRVTTEWIRFFIPKGYVAIAGTSLTIVDVDDSTGLFSVHLIPDTLRRTLLGRLKPQDRVNFEAEQNTITIVTAIERTISRLMKR
jgi:riboflavin synthase